MEIECPYCGKPASLLDSDQIFKESYGMIWACVPCDARVGVHKNDKNNKPLGTLANAETRQARKMAHKRFDPIWQSRLNKGKSKNKVRSKAYRWLAGHLGIPQDDCHIAMFDLVTCVKVIQICVKESYDDHADRD